MADQGNKQEKFIFQGTTQCLDAGTTFDSMSWEEVGRRGEGGTKGSE